MGYGAMEDKEKQNGSESMLTRWIEKMKSQQKNLFALVMLVMSMAWVFGDE